MKDEEKMEIKNIDREDEVLCPITWEVADTIITIYKWSYYLIYFEVQKVKIQVSTEWKKKHHMNTGSWWEIFNVFAWDMLMKIPLLWWLLVLFFVIYIGIFWIPLWIIIDLVLHKKIYGKWLIRINWKNEIYKVQEV